MIGQTKKESGYVDVVVGCQFGDEGKGGEVDRRASSGNYQISARFNGGANAGHQIQFNGKQIALHQVPSGIAHEGMLNLIGNGSLIDPVRLVSEFESIRALGIEVSPSRLAISDTAHLVLPHHIMLDELRELGSGAQGSTKVGIAFAAGDKYQRIGARTELIIHDPQQLSKIILGKIREFNQLRKAAGLIEKNPEAELKQWLAAAEAIHPFLTDTVKLLHERLEGGSHVLAEGAQSIGLDIEHGIYPLSTSSHATPGGMQNGLGISHRYLRSVIGVAKLTASRVGGESGPFVTRVEDEAIAERLRGKLGAIDAEFGKSTGRPRGMGYPDLPQIRRAVKVAGINELVLKKLDVIPRYGSEVKIAVSYDMQGEILTIAPNSALKLSLCKPVYLALSTWEEDISGIRDYQDLPAAAQQFVEFIEKQVGVPVSAVGVGPDREQIIIK